MPERQRGREPNKQRPKDALFLPAYHHAARYPDEQTSEQPYDQAKAAIRDVPTSVSAYRMLSPHDTLWYVAVLGDTPPEETRRRISEALSTGEQTTLPTDVLIVLNLRRIGQSMTPQAQQTGWVERSMRPWRRKGK